MGFCSHLHRDLNWEKSSRGASAVPQGNVCVPAQLHQAEQKGRLGKGPPQAM